MNIENEITSMAAVVDKAKDVLTEIVEGWCRLRFEIGLDALESPWPTIVAWGTEMLAGCGHEARDPLFNLYLHCGSPKIKEAARQALKELGIDDL